MLTVDQVQQLSELLPTTKTILVMVSARATFDQLAAASSLFVSLREQGKEVALLAPTTQVVQDQGLAGLADLKSELGNKDLQISFAYTPEQVDKVSYHIDEQDQRFYLVVKPKSGQKPLDADSIEMSYVGAEADLILLVGVSDLEELEQLYFGYEQLYQDSAIVTLHTYETAIGSIKLDASGLSSVSEAAAQLIQSLDMPLSADTATNLLAGIEEMTEGFRSLATTADTFEIVARLMRSGARRIKRNKPMGQKIAPPTVTSGVVVESQPSAPRGDSSVFSQALAANKKQLKKEKAKAKSKPLVASESTAVADPDDAEELADDESVSTKGDLHYQPNEYSPGGRG